MPAKVMVLKLFWGRYTVRALRFVGKHNNHLQLKLATKSSDGLLQAIAFSAQNKWPWLEENSQAEFAFRPSKNVWQNVTSLQLEIVDARKVES